MNFKKISIILGLSLFFFSGCAEAPLELQAENQQNYTADNLSEIAENIENQTNAPIQILNQEDAINIAINFIGYGDGYLANAFLENDVLMFTVGIWNEGIRYEVLIDSLSGDVVRMSRYTPDTIAEATEAPNYTPSAAEQTQTQQTNIGTSQAPANWPSEVAISREMAADIALSIIPGTLLEVDHDWEIGRAAWYVAIISAGITHEFKIDVQTGEVLYQGSW